MIDHFARTVARPGTVGTPAVLSDCNRLMSTIWSYFIDTCVLGGGGGLTPSAHFMEISIIRTPGKPGSSP